MTQNHAQQDTAATGSPKAGDSARVLLAGANLCWIALLWPMLVAGGFSGTDAVALALSVALVGGGTGALGHRLARWRNAAAGALLVGVPVVLSATLSLRPSTLADRAYGPLGSTVLVLSFLLYGGVTLHALSPRARAAQARCTPIDGDASPTRAARWPHQAVIALSAAGALLLAVVAPLWGGMAGLRAAWGEAAPEAGVLTAVLGCALGVAVLTVFGGAALRPPRRSRPAPDPTARVAMYLFLAVLGAVTYFVLRE